MKFRPKKSLGFAASIAGFALCGIGLWLLLSPAQYQAVVRVQFESNDPNVPVNYFPQVVFEVVRSDIVLSNVVDKLHLLENWDDQRNTMATAIHQLKNRTTFRNVRNRTWGMDIQVIDKKPETAARIANAIVQAYLDYRQRQFFEQVRRGLEALQEAYRKKEGDLDTRRAKVEELRRQLNVPAMELPEPVIKSNYPAYFGAWQGLTNEEADQKLLKAKIAEEESLISSGSISNMPVQLLIAAPAEPPKIPVGPNRTLGAVLLVCGLTFSLFGFYLHCLTGSTTGIKS